MSSRMIEYIVISLTIVMIAAVQHSKLECKHTVGQMKKQPIPAAWMNPAPGESSWRTQPCRFFADDGSCTKGDACRFHHIDNLGVDHHEQTPSIAWQGSTAATLMPTKFVGAHPKTGGSGFQKPQKVFGAPGHPTGAMIGGNASSSSGVSFLESSTALQKQETDNVYFWLNEARAEPMTDNTWLLKDAMHFQSSRFETLRYPYEELRTFDTEGNLFDQTQIAGKMDIVWCAMLYGRKQKVMTHLNAALLLGNSLRKEVRPRLAARNISFSNVLFVTEEACKKVSSKQLHSFGASRRCSSHM